MPTWTASDDPLTLADALDQQGIKQGDYRAIASILLRRLRPVPTTEEVLALTLEEMNHLVIEVLAPALQRAVNASNAVKTMIADAEQSKPKTP